MTAHFQFFMILGAAILLLIIFALLKKGQMSVKYSLLWLALAVVLVIFAVFPYVVYVLRDLLDVQMPVMDGLNLTLRIKEDSMLKKLPVLLFSSLITEKLRHKGVSVGADDQISKPEVTQLAHRAMALIKAREQA